MTIVAERLQTNVLVEAVTLMGKAYASPRRLQLLDRPPPPPVAA